jgi:hypothetical protein
LLLGSVFSHLFCKWRDNGISEAHNLISWLAEISGCIRHRFQLPDPVYFMKDVLNVTDTNMAAEKILQVIHKFI